MSKRKRKPRRPKKKPAQRRAEARAAGGRAIRHPADLPPLPDVPPMPDRRAMEGVMRQVIPGSARGGKTPLDEAQDLIYEAFEAGTPRERAALAKEALEISPDCADAYVLLAEHANTFRQAMSLYEQGVAAGQRALGPEAFREHEGHFWGVVETRPYMRARLGLAQCLWTAGRREEAVEHYREMLQLNPNDNQGVRYLAAAALLALDRDDELDALLADYEDDASADWAYARALLAFRREGDSGQARDLLAAAGETNAHVPAYLTGAKLVPRELPDYITAGGEDEAIGHAARFLAAWRNTPGATSWARKTLQVPPPEPPKRRKPSWRQLASRLAKLPQVPEARWQVDVRRVFETEDEEGEPIDVWVLGVADAEQGTILACETLEEEPSPADVLKELTRLMREPEQGEPHRPGCIEVRRESYRDAWQSKLEGIDVECRLCGTLEEVDALLEASEQLNPGAFLSNFVPPEDADLAALPQNPDEVWQAAVRPLPIWVEAEGGPERPWTSLVANVTDDLILATQMVPEEPADDWIWQGIQEAMLQPGVGEPHRPGVIQLAAEEQHRIVAPKLAAAGIECVVSRRLDQIDRILDSLSQHVAGPEKTQAMIDAPGMTPERLGSFFEAAADYYRRAPWRRVPGDTPIRIECDRFESGPWYAVVMGQEGMTLGLALYEDLDLLQALLSGGLSDEENARRSSGISLTYGEAFDMAARDLDAAAEHGWPIAGPEAHPCVMRINPGMALRPPLAWELELLEGSLRAVPEFTDRQAPSASLTVPAVGGELEMRLGWVEDAGNPWFQGSGAVGEKPSDERDEERRELSDEEAWELAIKDHPEWRRDWERGRLPDEITGEDGQPMSPRMHLLVHTIVERQLAADDPPGVASVARRLMRLGLSRHEVVHEIGVVVTQHMWSVAHEQQAFDQEQYLAEFEKIVEAHR